MTVSDRPRRAPGPAGERLTAEAALELHGFTWTRLEQLARGALRDRMRARRIFLDDDRYQEALEHYIDVGAAWAREYEPERARGMCLATSLYRRMYPRLTDCLRKWHGDQRRGTPLFQVPTDPSTLPLGATQADSDGFDVLVDALASRLPERSRWALEQLGRPIAEEDLSLAEAAARAGVEVDFAAGLLEELGWRLGRQWQPEPTGGGEMFSLMSAWSTG